MKLLALATMLLVGVASAGALDAKGTVGRNKGLPAITTITGSPVIVNIGADNSFQVFNTDIGNGTVGQIYPSGQNTLADMGWFVRVNGVLNAPNFSDRTTATSALGAVTPYGGQSVSGVTGNGTTTSPFSVTVLGTATGGLAVRQTVTYVNGDNYFRKSFRLSNPGAGAVSAEIFLASDIFLASSDAGIPFQESFSGSPGGQTCAGVSPTYTILHISLGTPASTRYTAGQFSNVWSQVGGGSLNNMIAAATCIDNGAGLQWSVSVPAGGEVTVQAATSFGDIPGALFGVGEPVWNYSVLPQPGVAQNAINCIRSKFPSNPPTNSFGWAPSEGQFYHEIFPGSPMQPPSGLARAILECFVQVWDPRGGALFNNYCWENPTPWYIGDYPELRQAHFRIYHAVNGICDGGPPQGTSVYEAFVKVSRRLYYPPLPPPPPPMLRDGFE